MKFTRFIFILFLFLAYRLQATQVNFIEEGPLKIQPGEIIRVDVAIANSSKQDKIFTCKIEAPAGIYPLVDGRSVSIRAQQQEIFTLYFRTDNKLQAGTYSIDVLFFNNEESLVLKKVFTVERRTRVTLNKSFFKERTVELSIDNQSNHPITFKNIIIAAFSKAMIPFTFQNKTSLRYYKEALEFFFEKEVVHKVNVYSEIHDERKARAAQDEFLFPIKYGSLYSRNKFFDTFTLTLDGGGQFSRNQELYFKFSLPFYHGTDPYIFYDPTTAIFYINYRFKHFKLIAGDGYYDNNPIFYYRYGRGYFGEYNNPETFSIKMGYVTHNVFFENNHKDLVFSLQNSVSPQFSYKSFYDFTHYNQNLGVLWKAEKNKRSAKGQIQVFNTDFKFDSQYLGVQASADYNSPSFQINLIGDYIGNEVQSRTNAEMKVLGSINARFNSIKAGFKTKASYQDLFPINVPNVYISNLQGSFWKKIGKTSNTLNFDYLTYENYLISRKNYSGFYSFNAIIGKNFNLSADQGLTYFKLLDNGEKKNWKTYSKLIGNYQYGRWNFSLGGLSQVRYFSDSLKSDNSLFFSTTFNADRSTAFLNFTFSNVTYDYKPYINFNYKSRFKYLDCEFDYRLIPKFSGYDYRLLVKVNLLQLIRIKKPVDIKTSFYDYNTKKPIDQFYVTKADKQKLFVSDGSIADRYTEFDLENLDFGSMGAKRDVRKTYQKESVLKEYTYQVDYKGMVSGFMEIASSRNRPSLNQLIYKQALYALAEDGKIYPGYLFSDGSYLIKELPVGNYEIVLDIEKLPSEVKFEKSEFIMDYSSSHLTLPLKATY
jgi:hypothetical protein